MYFMIKHNVSYLHHQRIKPKLPYSQSNALAIELHVSLGYWIYMYMFYTVCSSTWRFVYTYIFQTFGLSCIYLDIV